jgi:hypothetical protein
MSQWKASLGTAIKARTKILIRTAIHLNLDASQTPGNDGPALTILMGGNGETSCSFLGIVFVVFHHTHSPYESSDNRF